MRREIGSEFWDVPTTDQPNKLFPESAQWYLSGRSALKAIIADLGKARIVSMPSWCCDSMIKPFVDADITVRFYPIVFENGKLVQKINTDSDVLFLMDYLGYTCLQPDLNAYNGIVIRDITHTLFSATYSDANYYFGSLRKWCGIWTGGYAWASDGHKLRTKATDANKYVELRTKAMEMKRRYIEYGQGNKEYLEIFDSAEDYLETVGIAPAEERDVFFANHLDVELIKSRRRANAEVLRSNFPDWLIFSELNPSDTPMFVPVLVPNGKRDALRRYLINNTIFCPVHWPVSEYHQLDVSTAHIYLNELSLVCDQRYTEEDMSRMVETINTFMED